MSTINLNIMNNYCIKYNNGKYKTIEGKSKSDAEEKLKRMVKGVIVINEIIKIK